MDRTAEKPATATDSRATAWLSPRQKAAVIVRLLLSQGVDLPLTRLSEDAQATLAETLAHMRYVDGATLRAVVAEFAAEVAEAGLNFPSSLPEAIESLDGRLAPAVADRLRSSNGGAPPDPWARICALPREEQVALVADQAPAVGAVILSKLPTARAAAVLAALPVRQRVPIATAFPDTERTPSAAIARIGSALAASLDKRPIRAFTQDPVTRVGAILDQVPGSLREEVFSGYDKRSDEMGLRVRRAVFTFNDIPDRLDPRDVPLVLRGIPNDQVITALAGAELTAPDTIAFLLANMSGRMADQLREELSVTGPVRPSVAETAMATIVGRIRDLARKGEITLNAEEEE